MKSAFKIFSYFVFLTTYVLLFLIVSILVISQTELFRNFVKDQITETLNNKVNGSVTFSSIEGNLFSRLELNNPTIMDSVGDTVISADAIKINYMPLFLLAGQLNIANLELVNPVVRFSVSKSGENNFASLIKQDSSQTSDAADTTRSAPFIKNLNIKSIKITNGEMSLKIAKTDTGSYLKTTIDYDEQNFYKLNLWLSASHKSNKSSVELFDFSVIEKKSGYHITQLALKAELKENQILDINTLKIKTDSSEFLLLANLKFPRSLKTDTLFVDNLRHANLTASVKLTPFNFYDLYAFLPNVNMLKGDVVVDVKASGSLDTLRAESVIVSFGENTGLKLSGVLYHLLGGKKLKMSVDVEKGKIESGDVSKLLPTIPIPNFSQAGTVGLTAHYEGEPKTFKYKVELSSERSGKINAEGDFDFGKHPATYSVNAKTDHVNLGAWLDNPDLESDISLTTQVQGESFFFDELNLEGLITIDASRFKSHELESGLISVKSSGSKADVKVNLNTYYADAEIGGTVMKEDSLFTFDLTAGARRLDLSAVIPQTAKTKIDFSSEIDFVLGSNIFDAKIDLALNRFYVGNHQLPNGNISAALTTNPNETEVRLESEYLDFNLKSNKGFTYWEKWMTVTANNLTFLIDSARVVRWDDDQGNKNRNYASWNWKIKNIEPIMEIIQRDDIYAFGEGRGRTETLDTLLFSEFNIVMDSISIGREFQINNLKISADVDSIGNKHFLRYSSGKVSVNADEIITGDRLWGKLNFETISKNNSADYILSLSDPNNLLSLSTNGKVRFLPDTIEIKLKQMNVNSILASWKNDYESTLSVSKNSVGVDSLRVSSGKQSVTLSGELNENGNREMLLLGSNIQIAPIINMFNPGFVLLPEGQLNVRVFAYGLLSDPSIELNLFSSPILIKGVDYGQINGTANLADKDVDFSFLLVDKVQSEVAEFSGAIPNQEDSLKLKPHVNLKLNGFNLGLMNDFIPNVRDLGGIVNADFTVAFKDGKRDIQGELLVSQGSVRLESNNVLYSGIKGRAVVRNNFVNISGVDIMSPNNGKAILFGTFELENFIPVKNYNLSLAMTDFLVLNKVQSNDSNLYGVVEVQGQLKMRGGFEQSTLNGNIKLKKAEIGVISGAANDRTFLNEDSFISFVSATPDTTSKNETEKQAVFRFKKREKTFLSGFSAFIVADASQNTQFALLLNKATGERLETTAAGNLTIQYQRENLSLTGVMNVLSGRYDFYTAKFIVQNDGYLRWSGNAFEPELKLVAKTNLIRQRPSPTKSEETMAENNTLTINIEGAASTPKFTYDIISQLADGQTKSPATSPTLRDNIAANVISLILINQWANDPWLQTTTRNFSGVGTEDLISNTGYNALFGTLSNHLGRYLNSADSRIKYVNLNVQGNRGVTENWGISGGYEINDNWTVIGGFNYGSGNAGQTLTTQTANTQKNLNLSFRVENKLTENLSWDVFQEYDPYAFDPDLDNQTIYGVSLFYRKRFYYWNELNPFLKEDKNAKSKPTDRKSETGASPNPETEQRTQIQNQ